MKNTLLTTCNAKYIHKNLALRWIYTTCPQKQMVQLKEYTIKDDAKRISDEILAMKVEVVCFSCYIWNISITREIIHLLKEQNKDLHIIVGGPEVSYASFDLLEEGVDAICIGEGEKSVWEYIEMLSSEPKEICGICTKRFPNKEYQHVDLSWLETFENPYFLDMDITDLKNRYFYLETSRGCPYGCTYCLSSADRCVRMFSESYIMKILKCIAGSDIRQVKLLDRTFNADPKRALRIARFINEHCQNQIFQFEIVAETLSEELLQFFCEEADITRFRFEIGVQSFNTKTLQSVGRLQNNQRLFEVIRRLRDAGCIMHVDLIAGLPYEGMKSFGDSFDMLFSLQTNELQLGILKLLKGTKLREQIDNFSFTYEEAPPYNVTSTKWLNKLEMLQIDAAACAVEKFWNSGKCCFTIAKLLEKGWYTSAFSLFLALGKEYEKLKHPYQPYELFQCFYPLLEDHDRKEVDAILLRDYYANTRQKPHRFCDGYISLREKKNVLEKALEWRIDNQDTLYRYGVVDLAYDQEIGYQLILYNRNQTTAKRWYIDCDLRYIKEM